MKLIWIILLVVLVFGALIIGGYKLTNVTLLTEEDIRTDDTTLPIIGDADAVLVPRSLNNELALFPSTDGKGVIVRDFRNGVGTEQIQDDFGEGYYVISNNNEYTISYADSLLDEPQEFQIVVLGEPIRVWVVTAENEFLSKLDISARDACKLFVSVYLLGNGDSEARPIPLSFCN